MENSMKLPQKTKDRSSVGTNLTGINDDSGLIPGLAQWLRIQRYHELWCRSQTWLRYVVAVLWSRPVATPPIWPLPGKPPYAMSVALKKRQKKKKRKLKLPYPAIPFLGINPDKTIIQKDSCTPMFTSALFTIAKRWKHINVHWQTNGLRCGTYIQWNTTQP